MTEFLSMYIILIFSGLIGLCAIVMLLTLPQAVKEYSKQAGNSASRATPTGLSSLMEELSRCKVATRVQDLIKAITKEAENMSTDNAVQQRQRDSVLKWVEEFSMDMHINDLNSNNKSQQITFDNSKKDFKLTIVKK